MGTVYEALGPEGTAVALKVLRTSLTDADAATRFRREAQIRVDHPNVVRVIDAGIDPHAGEPYLALELLRGETLEDRLRAGPLHPTEVIRLGSAVARGLGAVHEAGILHRDVKPANLFCCLDGTIKVMDFGIALSASESRLTRASAVIGTPAYMSPEQVRGERELGPPCDVWSLGVVLYEAASGRSPYLRDTPLATMLAVHLEEPPPLWAVAPTVPRALSAVIEGATAKRPELRFATMGDLLAALASIEGDARTTPSARLSVPALRDGGAVPALPDGGEWGATEERSGPLGAPPTSVLPVNERRIVAVVVAERIADLAAINGVVGSMGGILIPLVGDRAVGVFGAARWEGDEVRRAALAALAARPFAASVAIASGRATSVGGGISGEVLTAAERGCERGLAGVATDVASARALEGEFRFAVIADGVYELLEQRRGHLEPSARDAPLLGRSGEMAQLRDRLRMLVEDRRGSVVLAVGTPGVGKSRLARALEDEIGACDELFTRLAIRAEPLLRDRAFAAVAGMLRERFATGAFSELLASLHDAIEDDDAARRCAEFIAELIGVQAPSTPALVAARADPQLMGDRLRLAVVDYVEALTRRGAVALVAEDLQWADSSSIALLEDLAERLRDAPFLIFASTRPELLETRADLFSAAELLRLEPRGLVSSDVRTLAEHVAGRALPPALTRAIAERTGGHPLFVEQVVLELAERAELDAEVVALPTTLTIEAAVQARIDQLPAVEKDACKRASVLGRAFLADELEGMGVHAPTDLLARLVRRDLMVTRAGGGRATKEFQFKSSLVADAVYALIAETPARELHRRAAAFLAERCGDDEEIARHHERGADIGHAATRFTAAALSASLRGDAQTVLRCSERALGLGIEKGAVFALYMARADALRFLGRRAEQSAELDAAAAAARGDSQTARVLTERTLLLSRTGRRAEAITSGEAAVAAAQRTGDVDVITSARAYLVLALIYGGDVARARPLLELATLEGGPASLHVRASLASVRAHLAMALGDLAERRTGFATAGELHRQAGDVRKAASADVNLADVENRVGRYAEAEVALRAALEGSRRVRNRPTEGYALCNLGYACAAQNKVDEARAALDQALALASAIGEPRLAVFARLYRWRGHARSDPAGAAPELLALADEAERVGDRSAMILSLSAVASSLLASGALALAVEPSGRALDLVERIGGIEEDEADVVLTRARVLEALGEHGEAAEVLARGRGRIDAVASRIRDDAARTSFLTRVVANAELVRRTDRR